jgi:HEAT repeat protein
MNVQTLIANLALPDETDRSCAAEDLGYAGTLEAIPPLVKRLPTESSRKVRETIFAALERIDRPEVLVEVVALLDADDAFLRNQAVALLQRKGAASVPVLLKRMNDADPDVRKFVLDTAAGISSPAVEPIFDAAMRDTDTNVQIAALEYLGEQRKARFRPAVERTFLFAKEPMLVCAAFATLLKIGDLASWHCIRQRYPTAASVPDWELCWWIRALGEFAKVGEVGVFQELLELHEKNVAPDAIVDALERFQARHGRVEISDAFWKLLRDLLPQNLEPDVKIQLLRVVGGFAAPRSIGDFLVALLAQKDSTLRLGAMEGIKRLKQPHLLKSIREPRRVELDSEIAAALGEDKAKP